MKILVVGAGFAGATIARELANDGHRVVVMDERNHIGRNAYDYTNEHGIRIHKYGPHLFHTNNKKVYDWITQYGEWVEYKHKVKAQLDDGRYVTLPVNKETQDIVGKENIVNTFFAPYTYKMWGKTIEELDPSILKRVPVRDDDNEYYFPNDEYQVLPKNGYTAVFEEILDHKNIKVDLDKYSFTIELEKIHKNGEIIPLFSRAGIHKSKNGTILEIIGISERIHSRKLGNIMQYAAFGPITSLFEESLNEQLFNELGISRKEKEALEWKAQTKREEDSLELVLKEKVRLKSLTNKDSLGTLIKRDSMKTKDLRLEQSIEEIEDLIEPISDSGNELQ